MNNRIYKLYNITDKTEYKGFCAKYECTINGEVGIFKERMNSASKDHIVEAIAYNIALICNVDCAFAKVRKTKDTIGSFSRFEIPEEVEFTNASYIYGKEELHITDLFKATSQMSGGFKSQLVHTLYKYMCFDFLVGQADRHLDNLALVKVGNKLLWYKLFDNGLALQSHLGNDESIKMLKLGHYRASVGLSGDIIELLHKLVNMIPYSKHCIELKFITFDNVYGVIDKCDIYNEIIKQRKTEMANFVVRQAEILNKIWG